MSASREGLGVEELTFVLAEFQGTILLPYGPLAGLERLTLRPQ